MKPVEGAIPCKLPNRQVGPLLIRQKIDSRLVWCSIQSNAPKRSEDQRSRAILMSVANVRMRIPFIPTHPLQVTSSLT